MSHTRIAFIGGGNMGRALLAALLRRGSAPADLRVADAHAPTREALARDFGVATFASNADAARDAGLVVLAVKPQEMSSVLAGLRDTVQRSRPLLVSVAAGIRCGDLDAWSGGGLDIVRAMPNRPALVGAGATALYAPAAVTAARRGAATRVMEPSGVVVWLSEESQMDVVTALSGSGPAYFFLLGEAMADAGVALGLDRATARRLAVATLHGAGQLAADVALPAEAGVDGGEVAPWALQRMRAEVTSKGGTTEAAVRAFEAGGFQALVLAALRAATDRSRDLAAQFGSSS